MEPAEVGTGGRMGEASRKKRRGKRRGGKVTALERGIRGKDGDEV